MPGYTSGKGFLCKGIYYLYRIPSTPVGLLHIFIVNPYYSPVCRILWSWLRPGNKLSTAYILCLRSYSLYVACWKFWIQVSFLFLFLSSLKKNLQLYSWCSFYYYFIAFFIHSWLSHVQRLFSTFSKFPKKVQHNIVHIYERVLIWLEVIFQVILKRDFFF